MFDRTTGAVDRTHFGLCKLAEDRTGLYDEITAQIYAVACPSVDWKKKQTS